MVELRANHRKIMRDMEVKAMTLKKWSESSVGHLTGAFHMLLKVSDTDKRPTGNWNPAAHLQAMFPDTITVFQTTFWEIYLQ